ncbi:hypothetical protein FNAPI_8518 [Fusarium napiforme]|uniref:Uncharacterized protein n=1 Tax=Fusarium napiforme TaxID=42672 RepID=A0A8H5J294_9HYPO|nr:hypothetical protein FNAPI_8518 [Fusarium napiforme]
MSKIVSRAQPQVQPPGQTHETRSREQKHPAEFRQDPVRLPKTLEKATQERTRWPMMFMEADIELHRRGKVGGCSIDGSNRAAKLLVALCVRSYVVSEPVLKIFDSDSEFNVFSDMSLVERYKRDIENVLRGKSAYEARWLLRKVHSSEPFTPVTVHGTPRYMWNTNAVIANLTTVNNARDWMQGNRISDKEAKRCDEEKRAGKSEKRAARTTQEMPINKRLALSDLSLPSALFYDETTSESGEYSIHTATRII